MKTFGVSQHGNSDDCHNMHLGKNDKINHKLFPELVTLDPFCRCAYTKAY